MENCEDVLLIFCQWITVLRREHTSNAAHSFSLRYSDCET